MPPSDRRRKAPGASEVGHHGFGLTLMRSGRRTAIALLAIGAIAGARIAAGAERSSTAGADTDWYRWQGETFTLYSAAEPWVTRPYWISMQRFAVMLPRVVEFPTDKTLPPIEIFLFDRPLERNRLIEIGVRDTPVAVSARGLAAAIATTSQRPLRDLKRGYAHLYFRTGDSTEYPFWYETGITRYFGRMYDDGDEFRVNVGFAAYLTGDRGSRLKDVVQYDENNATAPASRSFRDMSFALYHLLKHGIVDDPKAFSAKTRAFLERWRSGADPVSAFESSYEIALKKLNAAGERYRVFHGGEQIYYPLDTSDPRFVEPTPERLSRSEAAFQLARLALQFGRTAEARQLLEASLEAGSAAHTAAAECKLARLHADSLGGEAVPGLFRSLQQTPAAAPHCMLDEGQALLAAADREPSAAWIGPFAERARELALGVLQTQPDSAEALSLLGRSHTTPGQAVDKAIEPLQRALQLAWLDNSIRASLMHAYALNGRIEDATHTARTLLQWSDPRSEEHRVAREFLVDRAKRQQSGG